MKSDKGKNIVIGVLVVIILILVILMGLMLTGKIELKNDNEITNDQLTDQRNMEEDKKSLTKEEAVVLADELIAKSFDYFRNWGFFAYCGESLNGELAIDKNDSLISETGLTYYASKKFKMISELKEYLLTFLSNDVMERYFEDANNGWIVDRYKEQAGKLYCVVAPKGCPNHYSSEKSSYVIDNLTNDSIELTTKIAVYACSYEEDGSYINASLVLSKNSKDNWVISKYEEKK